MIAPLLAAGVTAGIVLGLPELRSGHPASGGTAPVSTAPVVRADLVDTTQVDGSLGYLGSYTLANQAQGTAYTWLPQIGATVRRGQRLYEVDGAKVVLFYGGRPEWRTLSAGVAPGPDVAQLDANLIALGYGSGLVVSDSYTGATAYAVELWQGAEGLAVTGTMPLGQVSYAPGAVRVTGVTPSLGATPQPGQPVLTATSTLPYVLASLPVAQEYLVKVGDHVTVTMSDGVTTVPGVVSYLSSVATQAPSTGSGGSSSGSGGSGSDSGSGSGQATVQMSVRLSDLAAAGSLDQEPVTVNVVTGQAQGVLAVPINALLALAGGGYAVEVVDGSARHLVAVRTGLFSSTSVQVTSTDLSAGMRVQVPSS